MKDVPRFGFVAGQWLSFKTNKPDGEEIIRAYSIASPPDSDNNFALCLNRVQDGFMSNFLCDMKEGDEIALPGTVRRFHSAPADARYDFHRHRHRDCSFPFHAALAFVPVESMPTRGRPSSIRAKQHQLSLIFGNRTEKDIYYHDEFLRLAKEHTNFHYLPTLSRGGPEWQGLRGYVQEHVPAIVQGRTDMHAYICGLDKMVKANRDLLKSLGWDRKSILYEKYD